VCVFRGLTRVSEEKEKEGESEADGRDGDVRLSTRCEQNGAGDPDSGGGDELVQAQVGLSRLFGGSKPFPCIQPGNRTRRSNGRDATRRRQSEQAASTKRSGAV